MTGEVEDEKKTETATWTTWEDLVLACAVKRHGFKAWDTIVMEIQTRTALPVVFTPEICRSKYRELKCRFGDELATNNTEEVDNEVDLPWIEDLRKLRISELKQNVIQYDLNIENLQLKVKKLEEEREQSLKENENEDDEKPGLEKVLKENRSDNDSARQSEDNKNGDGGKSVPGEDSDRSVNESNSTENREKADEGVSEPVIKPDPECKVMAEDSCNDSSDTVAKHLVASKTNQEKKDLEDLRDSTTESKEVAKESSDVQSSASLTKKRQSGEVSVGDRCRDEPFVVSPATSLKRDMLIKSEPLVRIFDVVRAHKHGPMFERRLDSQKTGKYKSIVRQHVDLRTVQTRLKDGSYSTNQNKFFLDLLLVFNNAIVFFPKSSPESVAAHELRDLVLKELQKKRGKDRKPDPIPDSTPAHIHPKSDPERSDSLLAKHKSAVPIVVCRKRSSIAAKSSSSNKLEKEKERESEEKVVVTPKPPLVKSSLRNPNEEESSMKASKLKEKQVVTGARSMRRSSNAHPNTTADKNHVPAQQLGNSSTKDKETSKDKDNSSDIASSPKLEINRNKEVELPTVKKRGAADFLKRIKKNSPGSTVVEPVKKLVEDNKKDQQKNKKTAVEEQKKEGGTTRQRSSGRQAAKEQESPSKRGVGRPPKKGKESPALPAKRGRESSDAAAEVVASKRPAKRSRR